MNTDTVSMAIGVCLIDEHALELEAFAAACTTAPFFCSTHAWSLFL